MTSVENNLLFDMMRKFPLKLLKKLIIWAKSQPEIVALYLYGSQAEGRANALSDVDVAILAQAKIPKTQLWRLEDQWAAQWPEYIDFRLLNLAPLPFRYEVTAHGQRIWAADVGAVAEIESLTWRQYWDVWPRLEQDWGCYVEHVMEQKNEAERQQYQTALTKVRAVHQRVREAAANYTGNLTLPATPFSIAPASLTSERRFYRS